MFKSYIKIAWRNFIKNRATSAVNIFGLATGITLVIILGAYVWSEWRVNKDLMNNDRIYLVQSRWKNPDMGYDFATLAPLAKALKENYPNLVTNYYHHDGITSIVSKGDKRFSEGLQVGDASMLAMFGFPLLYGDAATAFEHPNSLVITAAKAIKYFGKTDVVGHTLTIQSFSGSKQDFEITAVMKDPSYNTITYWGNGINKGSNEFFLPATSLKFFGRDAGFDSWQNAYIVNYVQLKEGVQPADLKQPVEKLLKLNAPADTQKNLQVYFTPIKDYYLQSNGGMAYRMIYSLALTALFILMMAVINFVNISIGNSVTRLKEIGVRKVMGSSKKQLIFQFLTESVLITAFAVAFAISAYILTRQFFSDMLGRQLPSLAAFPLYFLALPFVLILLVGFLAGLYPAFVLARQRSVESLKGKLETVQEKIIFRHSLIAIQFVTAIVVFVTAIVIHEQINFFFNSNLGYSKEQIVTARVPRDWTTPGVHHMETIRNEFAALPQVAGASFSFEIPDGASSGNNNNLYKASQDSTQGINAESLLTDEKFANTYRVPIAAGTFFNEGIGQPDTTAIVLNEAAAKALGWHNAADAVGQSLKVQGSQALFPVSGVVKDFHFGPMQERIRPMFFIHVRNALLYRYLSFQLRPGNIATNMAALQQEWSQLLPDAPFDYTFMNDTLTRLYTTEMQMKRASDAATIIALVIVLLGVLSIITQSITRRTREVGIRKVLGASVVQVIVLFAKEFAVILLIANVVAWPLAWLAASNWLGNYAYRIPLNIFPFISVSLILALLIAVLLILKTARTALSNPVNNLRTE